MKKRKPSKAVRRKKFARYMDHIAFMAACARRWFFRIHVNKRRQVCRHVTQIRSLLEGTTKPSALSFLGASVLSIAYTKIARMLLDHAWDDAITGPLHKLLGGPFEERQLTEDESKTFFAWYRMAEPQHRTSIDVALAVRKTRRNFKKRQAAKKERGKGSRERRWIRLEARMRQEIVPESFGSTSPLQASMLGTTSSLQTPKCLQF